MSILVVGVKDYDDLAGGIFPSELADALLKTLLDTTNWCQAIAVDVVAGPLSDEVSTSIGIGSRCAKRLGITHAIEYAR